ncbi:fluoride efflux transporter FluC [Brachybacterium sp. DNPG3]
MNDRPTQPDRPTRPDHPTQPDRPAHRRPGILALVLVGGAAGTAARALIGEALPPQGGIPVAVLAVNVLGAFLLGLLLDGLARRGPDQGRRRHLRLLLGTGFMGGFTTYSALAADSARLIGEGRAGAGIGYALTTVLVGAVATVAGIALSTALSARRPASTEEGE